MGAEELGELEKLAPRLSEYLELYQLKAGVFGRIRLVGWEKTRLFGGDSMIPHDFPRLGWWLVRKFSPWLVCCPILEVWEVGPTEFFHPPKNTYPLQNGGFGGVLTRLFYDLV